MQTSSPPGFSKIVFASVFGAVLEWYDFVVYGVLAALVLNHLFFPNVSPIIGTIAAFSTFAIGFVARPIGAYVLGRLGDRIGRKTALVITLVLIGLSTTLLGLLPTYDAIGLWAPIFLVVLRLLQGFAIGGEFGGAVLLVTEFANPKRRGWWASWPQAGGPAGALLASGTLALLTTFLTHDQFMQWGWRIPFLASAIIAALGWWIRRKVEESPIYLEAARRAAGTQQEPASALFRQPGPLLRAWGVRLLENTAFYLFGIFVVAYATRAELGFDRKLVLDVATLGAAFQLGGILLGGWLSDYLGRKTVMLAAAVALMAWSPLFFHLIDSRQVGNLYLAVIVALSLHGVLAGPEAAWMAELFPTQRRYVGSALAFNGASVFSGGPAPLIASALLAVTHSSSFIIWYIMLCGIVAVFSLVISPETRHLDLNKIGEARPI